MPGSFFLDSPAPPKLDLADARGQLFRTPQSPSPSSSLYYSISNFSRKRARYEESPLLDSQPDFTSPAPLVNTDYRLAGGADIRPTRLERPEVSAELDYRPNRYRERTLTSPVDVSVDSLTSSDVAVPGKSRKRSYGDSPSLVSYRSNEGDHPQLSTASWSRTVIDVVGKVWSFCCSGAFRGFYAGGGRGYDFPTSPPSRVEENTCQPTPRMRKSEAFAADIDNRRDQTPIPGQYPDDEIQRNWVVIPSGKDQGFFNGDGPSVTATSRAQRGSPGAVHRRRRSGVPRLGKRTVASAARPSTPSKMQASPATSKSPMSAETQRHAAQMRRIEREEDASLRRLNKQLQDMIKEGKQALGTRVEVEDMDLEDSD